MSAVDQASRYAINLPRSKNEALAPLMGAGKLLFGKLESEAWQDRWL